MSDIYNVRDACMSTIFIMSTGFWCALTRFVVWSLGVDDGRVSLLEHLLNQSISAPLILV